MTTEQKKHRHHTVPKSYLEHWARNRRMFCLKEGRIFSNGPQNLAVVNDFYRLNDLNDAEIAFLRAFAERLPDRNHEVISNFISMFTLHSRLARLLRPEMEEYQEILKAIDIHKSNLEGFRQHSCHGVWPISAGPDIGPLRSEGRDGCGV